MELTMEYRLLGASGLAVSRLCLGTMTFGHETDREGAFAQLDAFVEAGGTFIDTADVYSAGASEQIIGSWLAERPGVRDQVVIATKGRFPMATHPNGVGLSRRHLSDALEASLRRLGVDAVDLYQLHAWDPLTPVEEYLRFIDDAVSRGLVHYFGLSNFLGWQLSAVVERARAHGWTAPVSLQPQYNLLTRQIELEVVPACAEYGLGLMPWSPLAGGWLSGKYRRNELPSGATRLGENPARGMEGWERRNTEATWSVLEALAEVAEASGLTMAQTALAWLADRPQVTAPILGNRTTEQLAASLAVAEVHLDHDATARLDAASAPALPDYPYGELGVGQRSRALAARA
jgi:aryl-alcohol dehydrogenase-like predicted oxidoreductase